MHSSRTASAGPVRLPSIRIRSESRQIRARLLLHLLWLSLIPALAGQEANTFFSASTDSSPAAADKPLIPVISGEWWRVAGNPDLGELTSERQEPVDFAVWQAADGTWQLWSCIRHTKEPRFTTQRYHGEPSTTVFASRDPLHFGIDDDRLETTTLSAAAPEIIHHEGKWYIAALTPELDGIRIARLQ